ncbi:hypothetical protein ACFP8W_07905 [Nocardioides hankookensis]
MDWPLLAALDTEERGRILRAARRRSYARGDVLKRVRCRAVFEARVIR